MPHAATIRHVFDIVLKHYVSTEPERCETLRWYLQTLDQAQDPQLQGLGDDLAQVVERNPRSPGVLRVIQFALSYTPHDRRCSAPQCERTMLDREEEQYKALSVCARCRLTRYCTKACQHSDWTAGQPIRHKLMCPILANLYAAADVRLPGDEFVHAVQNSTVSDEHLAMAGVL
ncbi:hypothetical protein AURDEDRAFT_173788 [Auricularia subglabra TFB-10046 SS5]|nr:hypothetical protein AURDEDRAFT_173788 [Auricularia subglabra TFB-10046 SS5]